MQTIETGKLYTVEEFKAETGYTNGMIWGLMTEGKLALHKHHHRASLTEEELDECIEVGGEVYHAVSVR